jgi:hypothetical protein
MWRLWVSPLGCCGRLCRIIAVRGQYSVENCRVGSRVSVAAHFLGL